MSDIFKRSVQIQWQKIECISRHRKEQKQRPYPKVAGRMDRLDPSLGDFQSLRVRMYTVVPDAFLEHGSDQFAANCYMDTEWNKRIMRQWKNVSR